MKIINEELVEKYCLFCPNAIKGKPMDDDFPIFEYKCNLKNRILGENLVIPHWCPLNDYVNEDII